MNIKKFSTLCFFLILLTTMTVYGEENLSRSSALCCRPAISVNQDGVIMVVWTEFGDKSGTIFYNIYRNGSWEGAKDAGLNLQNSSIPSLDYDAEGNFHLTFADGPNSRSREIYYTRFDVASASQDLASGWSAAEQIWDSPDNSAWQKMDVVNDRIYIVWYHQNVDPYIGADIVLQSKKIEDKKWPYPYERFTYTANLLAIHPAFMVKATENNSASVEDTIHVCYMENFTTDAAPWGIKYKEGLRGSSWINNPPETVMGSGAYYPELVVDDEGNVHIVFSNKTGNIFYKERAGDNWKATQVISNKYAELQFTDLWHWYNLIVAVWVQQFEGNSYVYYSKKSVGEKTINTNWENPVKFSDGRSALEPQVCIDEEGYAHFVWVDKIGSASSNIFYDKVKVGEPKAKPPMKLNKDSLSFTAMKGENPDSKTFTLKNEGTRSLSYTASVNQNWMSVTPASGSLGAKEKDTFQVQIDVSSLDPGKYNGVIEISSAQAANSPQQVSVTLVVLTPPTLQLDKRSLSFSTIEEITPDPKRFSIENVGDRRLSYTVSASQNWISVTPASGSLGASEKGTFQVQINVSSLDEDTYEGVITISSSEAINSPQQVSVSLEVLRPPISAPLNFAGEVIENKTLFYREYIHKLTWASNPNNKNIEKYMLYEISGVNRILLQEFTSSTFEYQRRRVDKNKSYTYELYAVDNKDRAGTEPAKLVIE